MILTCVILPPSYLFVSVWAFSASYNPWARERHRQTESVRPLGRACETCTHTNKCELESRARKLSVFAFCQVFFPVTAAPCSWLPLHLCKEAEKLSPIVDGRGEGHRTHHQSDSTAAVSCLTPDRNASVGPVPPAHVPGRSHAADRGSLSSNHWCKPLVFPARSPCFLLLTWSQLPRIQVWVHQTQHPEPGFLPCSFTPSLLTPSLYIGRTFRSHQDQGRAQVKNIRWCQSVLNFRGKVEVAVSPHLIHPLNLGNNWPGFLALVREMFVDGFCSSEARCGMCIALAGDAVPVHGLPFFSLSS